MLDSIPHGRPMPVVFVSIFVCSTLRVLWMLSVELVLMSGCSCSGNIWEPKKIIELYCTCLDFDDDWIYFCVIVFEDAQCYFVGFEKLEILPFFAGDSCETTTK